MKVIVAYDTYYGNTKQVAEAIADEFRSAGHEAEILNVKDEHNSPQGDLLVIGTPIRMAKVPRPARRFIKRLDREAWKGKPIIVLTTVGPLKENPTEKDRETAQKWGYNPGLKFRDKIKSRGLSPVEQVLYVEVKDLKGPLVDTGIEKARQYIRDYLKGAPR